MNAVTVMVAVMQLIREVINAVTVAIAVMVDVSSGFSKSTHIGPKRVNPRIYPSEFTQHLQNLQATFAIYPPLQNSLTLRVFAVDHNFP